MIDPTLKCEITLQQAYPDGVPEIPQGWEFVRFGIAPLEKGETFLHSMDAARSTYLSPGVPRIIVQRSPGSVAGAQRDIRYWVDRNEQMERERDALRAERDKLAEHNALLLVKNNIAGKLLEQTTRDVLAQESGNTTPPQPTIRFVADDHGPVNLKAGDRLKVKVTATPAKARCWIVTEMPMDSNGLRGSGDLYLYGNGQTVRVTVGRELKPIMREQVYEAAANHLSCANEDGFAFLRELGIEVEEC